MVESAPLFIEYYCQGYVNCTAFNAVVLVLSVCCAASWLTSYLCIRTLAKRIPY